VVVSATTGFSFFFRRKKKKRRQRLAAYIYTFGNSISVDSQEDFGKNGD
jgi:hypothetical protein